jgi:hypothetical protein
VSPGALIKIMRDNGISVNLDPEGKLQIHPVSKVPPKLLELLDIERQAITLHMTLMLGYVYAATGGSLMAKPLPEEFSSLLWAAWRNELVADRFKYNNRVWRDINEFVLEKLLYYCHPLHFAPSRDALQFALDLVTSKEVSQAKR